MTVATRTVVRVVVRLLIIEFKVFGKTDTKGNTSTMKKTLAIPNLVGVIVR